MTQTRTLADHNYQNAFYAKGGSHHFPIETRPKVSPSMMRETPHSIYTKTKSASLSSQFPFNQCSDTSLRETKKSVEFGVRYAVRQYFNFEFQKFHYNENSLFRTDTSWDRKPAWPQYYWEFVPKTLSSSKNRQILLQLPPILVPKGEPNREMLISLLKKVLNICIQKKMNLSQSNMDDVMVQQALHYATNKFLQNFKSSSTRELCNDIIRDKLSGELNEALSDLVGDFLDKYEDIALESYEDVITDGVTDPESRQKSATVENPCFTSSFKNIWKLDPSNFLDFNVRVFIEEYTGVESRPFSFNSFRENFTVKLGEVALMMNILKATVNYRSELLALKDPPAEVLDENIDKMEEFGDLQRTLLYLMEKAEQKTQIKRKSKSLRFAELPTI